MSRGGLYARVATVVVIRRKLSGSRRCQQASGQARRPVFSSQLPFNQLGDLDPGLPRDSVSSA